MRGVKLPPPCRTNPKEAVAHCLGVAQLMGRPVYLVSDGVDFRATLEKPSEPSYVEVQPGGHCVATGGFTLFDLGGTEQ